MNKIIKGAIIALLLSSAQSAVLEGAIEIQVDIIIDLTI